MKKLYRQGSTACCVAITTDDHEVKSFVTANVGDSRAVLARNGIAVDLTMDHKPDSPEEKKRIESVGGRVKWHGLWNKDGSPQAGTGVFRVNGNLALSRSIGSHWLLFSFLMF